MRQAQEVSYMHSVKELEVGENGELVLGPELAEALNLSQNKVRCIFEDGRVVILPWRTLTDELCGSLGEEKVDEYQFDIEPSRFWR